MSNKNLNSLVFSKTKILQLSFLSNERKRICLVFLKKEFGNKFTKKISYTESSWGLGGLTKKRNLDHLK